MDFLEEADTAGNFAGDTGAPKGGLASIYIYIHIVYIHREQVQFITLPLKYIHIYNIIEWGEVANLGIFLEVAKTNISKNNLGVSSFPSIFSLCKKWFEMNMGISMDIKLTPPQKKGNHQSQRFSNMW